MILTVGLASSAAATVESPANDTLNVIAEITPEVFENIADSDALKQGQLGGTIALEGDVKVSLPADPADALTLEAADGTVLEVVLPIESTDADIAANGLATFSAGASTELVPAIKDDGSVQVTTVLSGPDAPTRYEYAFPPDNVLELAEDGFVIIRDGSGDFAGGVLPPWAIDANGEEVPTHFELTGSSLTQVIDHSAAAYPVVADPYMGKKLISKVVVGTDKGKPRYGVTKTTWGNAVAAGRGVMNGPNSDDPLLGAHIMRNEGWKEAVSLGLSTATTIRQQYDCHTVYAATKNPWNLERWRGNNDWWLVNPHLCNWNW